MNFLILLILTAAVHGGGTADPVCKSSICEETGKRIAEYMDKTPKYCEDFYESACGGFLKNEKYSEDGGIYLQNKLQEDIIFQIENILEENPGPSGNLFTQVKTMYQLCLKNDKNYDQMVKTVREKLEEVGDWPIFNDIWVGDKWNFEEIEVKMRDKGFHHGSLVQFRIIVPQKTPQHYILQVLPGDQWKSLKTLTSKGEEYDKYKQNMINVVKALRRSDDEVAANTYVESTLESYTKLLSMLEANKDEDNQGRLITVRDLSETVPKVNWNKLMSGFTELKQEDNIYIKDIKYLESLEHFLELNKKGAADIMLWHAIRNLIKIHDRPSKYSQANNQQDDDDDDDEDGDSEQKSGGSGDSDINSIDTIEAYCSTQIYQKLPLAVSYFYVKKYFPKSTRDEAKKIVDHIKEEFLHHIDGLKWMKDDGTPTTRELAKEKVKNMKTVVGYDDKLEDIQNIEKVYEGLKIELDNNNYALANMAWNKWSTELIYERFKRVVADTKFWDDSSVWTRKYYNPYDNTLSIPAGIIQSPYFSPGLPNYVNYAIFGRMIGEHITEAIFNEGKFYNPEGHWSSGTWWSSETKDEYTKIESCFQKVYGGYVCRNEDCINSRDTLEKNMADQGAVKLAYNAYKKNFPNEKINLPNLSKLSMNQLFWLAGAHVWCTKLDDQDIEKMLQKYKVAAPEIRVNAAYGMMHEFHVDFKCDSKQNPQEKGLQKNPLYPEEQCDFL